MKLTKRFLCLLLSLCMVFLAVPAFAFPIVAAGAEATSTTNSPAYQPGKPLDSDQMPVATGTNDGNPAITYPGSWEMIVYDDPTKISNSSNAAPIQYYTTNNGVATAFRSAYKDYGAAATAPLLVNDAASEKSWGEDYAFLFNFSQDGATAVGGFRYTAEYAGYIQTSFDELRRNVTSSAKLPAKSFTAVRIAIFVDGVMVWPTANGKATDYTNWYQPFSLPEGVTEVAKDGSATANTTLQGKYINKKDTINAELAEISIYVQEGSQVDFLMTYSEAITYTQQTINRFLPAVSYSEVIDSEGENTPAYQPGKPLDSNQMPVATGTNDGNPAITYPGSWEMIVYDDPTKISNSSNAALIQYYTTNNGVATAFRSAYKDYGAAATAPLLVNDAASEKSWGEDYAFLFNIPQDGSAAVGGFRYTAEHAGYIQASFDELRRNITSSAKLPVKSFEAVRIAIFVDGVMVWPTANGKATDYTNWYQPFSLPEGVTEVAKDGSPTANTALQDKYINKKDTINAELAELSIYVQEGSQVDFLITYDSYVQYTQQTINRFLPAVSYSEVIDSDNTIVTDTSFYDNLPTYDEQNMAVNYLGGWQVGVYDRYGEKFMPYSDCIDKNSLLCNYGDAWSQWGGFYIDENPRFTMSTGTIPSGNFWSQIQYTTPLTGTISIDLQELKGTEDSSKTAAAAQPLSFKIAIYKNGDKIWPAGNEWAAVAKDGGSEIDLLDVLQEQYPDAFPLQVNVNAGDTIEFRAENQNDTSYMLAMNPGIIYAALNEAPNVTATGVTVKETFTLNVYTHLNSGRTDYVASGLKYWTSLADAENKADNYKALSAVYTQDDTAKGAVFSDVTEMYSIKGISAWELNKSYYVRTWVQYADGTVKDGDVVEVSVIGYAQNAINKTDIDSSLNRIATALLQYTIAIEEYRGNDCGLTMPDKLPVMPVIIPENVYSLTTLEGGKVTMLGANLVLGETIDLVIDFTTTLSKDRAEKLVVLMDDNASFLTPQELKAVEVEDGIYRVTVKVRTVDFSKPFYFKVMDHRGDVQSGVLTYSVESYVARKCEQEPENAELIALLNSMLVLCKTANDIR